MDSNNPHNAARDLLRRGDVVQAFDLLSLLGFIRDASIPIIDEVVVHSVLNFGLKAPYETIFPTTIVCAASWCGSVTDAVRAKLKRESLTTRFGSALPVDRIDELHFTNEDKSRPRAYAQGQVIDVHQSSSGLKKGQSYHVKQVESSGAVRLDNGAVLPLNLPDTFSVHQRCPMGFELCVGDLVRLPHKTPDMPSVMDPRLTYRVIGLMGGSVFLKEAWGSTATNGIAARSAGDDRFAVSTTYGRFTYAYCQTPAAPMERVYDYIHSIQEGSTRGIDAVRQLRNCVLGARTHSLTFTTDVQSLRNTILLASEAKTLLTRHELDTAMEATNHRSKTPILSLVAARALKAGFDHER